MPKTAQYRYWPLTITGLVMLVGYLDRINLAVAAPVLSKDLQLEPGQMGLLFSVFLIGYAVMPAPGGFLADKFGARAVLTFTTGWFSIFSAFTAIGWNFLSMFVIRLLFGIGEGASVPAMLKANQTWSGVHERGLGSAIMLTGVNVGGILAPLITVAIMTNFGWHAVFYIMAIPGLIVTLLVWLYVRNRPQEILSDAEIARAALVLPTEVPINRTRMYRSGSVWAVFIGWFFFNMTFWGLALWVPSYLFEARHVNLHALGIWASLPWVGGLLGSYAGAWTSDKVRRRKYVQSVGWILAGVFTGLTYMADSPTSAIALLTAAYFFMQAGATVNYSVMMVLVGVEAAGVAMGSMQSIGVCAGFVAPAIIGFILQATHSYAIPFVILSGAIFIGGIIITLVREARIDLSLSPVASTASNAESMRNA